jgi:hypothetical protein
MSECGNRARALPRKPPKLGTLAGWLAGLLDLLGAAKAAHGVVEELLP